MAQMLKPLFGLLLTFTLPVSPADPVMCSLGSSDAIYNSYSDERPSADARELSGRINAVLGDVCRPNCPMMAMFRNGTALNLMLTAGPAGAKIVYKPEFFTKVYDAYGDPGILALLAHEVGHAIE